MSRGQDFARANDWRSVEHWLDADKTIDVQRETEGEAATALLVCFDLSPGLRSVSRDSIRSAAGSRIACDRDDRTIAVD